MQEPADGLQQSFFELFNLPARYQLDNALLDQQYHTLQAQFRPETLARLSEVERRGAVQAAARLGEAYQTLRSPSRRAGYLLELHGVKVPEDNGLPIPAMFEMPHMEWREAIADAQRTGDARLLGELEMRLQRELRETDSRLAEKIDSEHDYAAALEAVRKSRFLERIAEEIAFASSAIIVRKS